MMDILVSGRKALLQVRRAVTEGKHVRSANESNMPSTRRDLGQFFTPRPVIDFALNLISDFGAQIDGARVCDPACGPGEWLDGALAAGAGEVLGIDRDLAMIGRWREMRLVSRPRAHMLVADGLSAIAPLTGWADVVLGNPPFGVDLPDTGERALREIATEYQLPSTGRRPRLFEHPSPEELGRLRRFPIELLFLERFWQICAPGGWIAIVLPEGVFANSRWRHVREWLLAETTVHVVAGLPRGTFRAHATTARTCLLLLRNASPPPGHATALCRADDCDHATLAALREALARSEAPPDSLDLNPPIFAG